MPESILESTIALRDAAYEAWVNAGAQVAALEQAVLAMGGPARARSADVLRPSGETIRSNTKGAVAKAVSNANRRLSQADAAERLLRDADRPMTGLSLIAQLDTLGVRVTGENPTANFTSTLSRDKRFCSFRKNGLYYWWFEGEQLPSDWNETADPDLLSESADSLSQSNQEGGESNAPTVS